MLPIHGIGHLHFLSAVDEVGVKYWSELTVTPPSLQAIRLMFKIASLALSFPGQEPWSVEKIQSSFADAVQVANVFNACLALSDFASPNANTSQPKPGKPGAYS
jgi:hypothetical protein